LRDTVDPLAGSYFVETLTKEMEEKILEEMEKVEKLGGMVQAVSSGYVQREVARQAYEYEKAASGRNHDQGRGEQIYRGRGHGGGTPRIQRGWAQLQIQRLKDFRRERDNAGAVKNSLKALEGGCQKRRM
jgi:methylmalonyl-CoA mutase, N-terminal domain